MSNNMKNKIKTLLVILGLFLFPIGIVKGADATTITYGDLPKGTYVIGTHIFEPEDDYIMTIKSIMKAAKSLSETDEVRIIYKNMKGEYVDASEYDKTTGKYKVIEATDIKDSTVLEYDHKNEKATYSVTFDSDGGSKVVNQGVIAGNAATPPEDPTKEGFAFDGWYLVTVNGDETETVAESPYVFATPISKSIKLKAKWTAAYVVSFNTGDSEAEVANQNVREGGKATKPADPTWAMHEFDGWLDEDNQPFDFNTVITGPTRLTAKWTELHTVILQATDHNDSTAKRILVRHGSNLEDTKNVKAIEDLGMNEIVADGSTSYIFDGWLKDETPYDMSTAINADLSLKASWKILYTVTFYETAEGNPFSEVITTLKVKDGDSVDYTKLGETWEEYASSKTGFTFDSWKKYNGDTNSFVDYDNTTEKVTANLSLHAIWQTVPVYNVVFIDQKNGANKTVKINKGGQVEKPTDTAKEGYRFVDWYQEEELENLFDFTTQINDNTNIYPKWEKVWEVEFVTGDGATQIDSQFIVTGHAATRPETDPTRAGYQFKGWTGDPAIGEDFDFETLITEKTTITAKWEAIPYTVTFKDGEETKGTATVRYNNKISSSDIPSLTKEHYTLKGWTLEDGTEFDVTKDKVKGNLTLFADWDAEKVKVTFMDGDTKLKEVNVSYNTEIKTADIPSTTKQGQVFEGWYYNSNLIDLATFKFTEAVTLYGEWYNAGTETLSYSSETSVTPASLLETGQEIDPAGEVTSSNSNVAVVDPDGNITIVGTGTTTITIPVQGQEEPVQVQIEGYLLNPTMSLSMAASSTKSVTDLAALAPSDSVILKALTAENVSEYTFASATPVVVDVESGTINAKAAGTATITVNKEGSPETETIEVVVRVDLLDKVARITAKYFNKYDASNTLYTASDSAFDASILYYEVGTYNGYDPGFIKINDKFYSKSDPKILMIGATESSLNNLPAGTNPYAAISMDIFKVENNKLYVATPWLFVNTKVNQKTTVLCGETTFEIPSIYSTNSLSLLQVKPGTYYAETDTEYTNPIEYENTGTITGKKVNVTFNEPEGFVELVIKSSGRNLGETMYVLKEEEDIMMMYAISPEEGKYVYQIYGADILDAEYSEEGGNPVIKYNASGAMNRTLIVPDKGIVTINVTASYNEGGSPTIATCPDCVYTYSSNYIFASGKDQSTLTASQYTTNYKAVVKSNKKNHFLGLKLNGENKVVEAYACGIKNFGRNNQKIYCLKGANDDSEYNSNKGILDEVFSTSECTLTPDGKVKDCLGGGSNGNAEYSGAVSTGDQNDYCSVDEFGGAICN